MRGVDVSGMALAVRCRVGRAFGVVGWVKAPGTMVDETRPRALLPTRRRTDAPSRVGKSAHSKNGGRRASATCALLPTLHSDLPEIHTHAEFCLDDLLFSGLV